MNTGHPRDVDPSITGQPHQVTGNSSRPDGQHFEDAWYPSGHASGGTEFRTAAPRARFRPGIYAAPRCSASHTAVDSLAPSPTALPQWAIQAAIPSGVPDA